MASALAIPLALSGCSSSDSGDKGSSNGNFDVTVFMPARQLAPYYAKYHSSLIEEGKRLGITFSFVENQGDQSAEDVQVQQEIASGSKPDAYLWWPANAAAGTASLQKLSSSKVPVFITNQPPLPEQDGFFKAFVGTNDEDAGKQSAEALIKLRDEWKSDGKKLHGDGQVLAINAPAAVAASAARSKGLEEGLEGSGIKVIDEIKSNFSPEAAFTDASAAIAANKSKGIDFLWGQSDFSHVAGGIKALEQAGYKPGEDVGVVGDSCDGATMKAGKLYATVVQAPQIEAELGAIILNRYLRGDHKVVDGVNRNAPDPNSAPAETGDVHKYEYMPLPIWYHSEIDSLKLWGSTATELCTY